MNYPAPAVVGNTIFPFGPGLYAAQMSDAEVATIIEHATGETRDEASAGLVGNIEKEVWCGAEWTATVLQPMLSPHVQQYLNELSISGRIGPSTPVAYNAARHHDGANGKEVEMQTELRIASAWVNFTSPGPDFNPPHIHNSDLSCILYLDLPDEMLTIHEDSKTRWRSNGCTQFMYGNAAPFSTNEFIVDPPTLGRLIIFPANLTYYVMPYYNKSGQKRVTLSANFQLEQSLTEQPWQRKYEWDEPSPAK